MKRKFVGVVLSVAIVASMLTGCSKTSSAKEDVEKDSAISVISREDGSGTRGAFVELFGVEQKDDEGNKVDHTTEEAIVTNSTSVMMTTVAGDDNAIGYISLGALNSSVKAVPIDGVEATADNVNSGEYKVSRPFNIVTKGEVNEVGTDFMNFITSADGQKVIADYKYIPISDTGAFTSTNPSGKVVVAGSSSVTPVMEKLKEAYVAINFGADIEIQESDSTTGISSVIDGIADIGMASRDLKDSEKSDDITSTVIAIDGIAVVVNNNNDVQSLSTEQVMKIYTGEFTNWSDVK